VLAYRDTIDELVTRCVKSLGPEERAEALIAADPHADRAQRRGDDPLGSARFQQAHADDRGHGDEDADADRRAAEAGGDDGGGVLACRRFGRGVLTFVNEARAGNHVRQRRGRFDHRRRFAALARGDAHRRLGFAVQVVLVVGVQQKALAVHHALAPRRRDEDAAAKQIAFDALLAHLADCSRRRPQFALHRPQRRRQRRDDQRRQDQRQERVHPQRENAPDHDQHADDENGDGTHEAALYRRGEAIGATHAPARARSVQRRGFASFPWRTTRQTRGKAPALNEAVTPMGSVFSVEDVGIAAF